TPADLQGLAREEKERLLTVLATDILRESPSEISVFDQAKNEVALLVRAPNRETEYSDAWTVGHILEYQWRASTPENSVPWPVMLARIAKELGVERQE